jgi:nucleoid-associated protein YgaU
MTRPEPTTHSGYTDYIVKKGDTLSLLAKRFYHDAGKFHLIQDANENLKYQGLLEGSRIRIPAEK